MLENLINAGEFNITLARYLLLYAVYGYFLRLSLWVEVILFCSPLGVCNQELEKLESLGKLEFLEELVKLENLELLERLEDLESLAPTRLKRKIGLESLKIRR